VGASYVARHSRLKRGDETDRVPSETLQRYFQIWFSAGVVWIVGWVLASTWYRKSRRKPILFWDVPGATFIEKAASGHSNRSWYTRIGGAGNRINARKRFGYSQTVCRRNARIVKAVNDTD